MKSLVSITLAASFLLVAGGAAVSQELDSLWAVKTKTDRTIVLELTVDAPPAELFRLWTTEEGTRKFLAPAAKIDPRVGGRYEIIFEPDNDPEGAYHGTKGAKILRLVPDREVAFEWPMPPLGPELGAIPNPTWVELRFDPVEGDPGKTLVRFAHYGFRKGGNWDKGFELFRDRNWPLVFDRLATYCREHKSPSSSEKN